MSGLFKVMIIRHAEKPDKHAASRGVNAAGEPDDESLTVRGWQRAGALVPLLASATPVSANPLLARPSTVYASDPHGGSNRPLQTITPLADMLGIKPVKAFKKGDEADLARAVSLQQGVVLIAWQHEKIRDIVMHLTAGVLPVTAIPNDWPDDRFDMIWVLTPSQTATTWSLVQVPQLLLDGDSPVLFE